MTEHQYRRDIDGLRAIAVIAVVLYHAGFSAFRGGFVGVDVFFVISGFLITQFIDERVRAGAFSFGEFYERRVRRIAPALFTVLFACGITAYFLLLPVDLRNFCSNLGTSVAFSLNLLLWRQDNYFGAAAHTKPLLHLWSLSVEEQFYIVFPICFIYLTTRMARFRIPILLFGLVASFAASAWSVYPHPQATFFLLPTRAWEFVLGSLLALDTLPRLENRLLGNGIALAGFTGILWSIFAYSRATPFPGLSAAIPCIGTCMLIYANGETPTIAGRVMSVRPLVGIGLISYSLYLWHWPIMVFARQWMFRPLTSFESVLAILASLALAAASWKLIERPFRKPNGIFSRRRLFVHSSWMAALLMVGGLVGYVQKGFPQRFSPQVVRYDSAKLDFSPDVLGRCLYQMTPSRMLRNDFCVAGPGSGQSPRFIVWGDSHSISLMPAFKALAVEAGTTGWFAGHGSCPPLLGVTQSAPGPSCLDFNNAMLEAIERKDIHTVVLVAAWKVYMLGRTPVVQDDETPGFFITDAQSRETSPAESRLVFERGLRRTLSRLTSRGRQVYLVLDVPHTSFSVPDFLASESKAGRIGAEAWIECSQFIAPQNLVRSLFMNLAAEYRVSVIDPASLWSDGSRCLVARDGQSLYVDNNHVTTFGALQLTKPLLPIFDQINPKK